jgi:hypothetical protein
MTEEIPKFSWSFARFAGMFELVLLDEAGQGMAEPKVKNVDWFERVGFDKENEKLKGGSGEGELDSDLMAGK